MTHAIESGETGTRVCELQGIDPYSILPSECAHWLLLEYHPTGTISGKRGEYVLYNGKAAHPGIENIDPRTGEVGPLSGTVTFKMKA